MKRGFTLIELLLVLAILAGLAAIILPTVVGWGRTSKTTAAEGNVHTIRVAVESYYLDKSVLPYDDNCTNTDNRDASGGAANGIPDWIDDLATADNTILTSIKKDPWDNDYYFDTNNSAPRKWFVVLSYGPNKTTTYNAGGDPLSDNVLASTEVDSDDIFDTNAQTPAK